MSLWPSKKQWKSWSLPSKYAAIGVLVAIVGIALTVLLSYLSSDANTTVIGDNIGGDKFIVSGDYIAGDSIVNIDERTSASYVPPDTSLRNIVLKNLQSLRSRYADRNLQVIVEVEAGNSLRDRVANDIGEILSKSNLGHYAKGNMYIGRFPDHPITVLCSPVNALFAKEFVTCVAPFIAGDVRFQSDFQSNEIMKVYLNGTPTFSAKGEVKIE